MLFSSVFFLFTFLPIVLLIYNILPKNKKNLFLFISSLFFYAWGEPIYVLIMIFSTFFDYTVGRLIEKNDDNNKKRKLLLILSVVVNLGMLFVFKYSDFAIFNINNMLNLNIPLLGLSLPIGISFYTFQTMSYTIDVYLRKVKAQHDIIAFGTYVALFPQLIAGPIVRYITVEKEINSRKQSINLFADGVTRFIQGLGKKVIIANTLGAVWADIKITSLNDLVFLDSWIGIICFALQIYFDFSGYSDMAIGLGKMFGFKFLENFNYPYISKSITEFWRRWHISLSSWFKEYVYIPLGGNKYGILKQLRNIVIVWLLTGFWHGAEWNFIMWGVYFASILIIEKLFLYKVLEKLPKIICHIYSLILILIGWVLFEFSDVNLIISYVKEMFTYDSKLISNIGLYTINSNYIFIILGLILATPLPNKIFNKLQDSKFKYINAVVLLITFITSIAFLVDSTYNPFLYFRF